MIAQIGLLLMIGTIVVLGIVFGYRFYKSDSIDSVPKWAHAGTLTLYCIGMVMLGTTQVGAPPKTPLFAFLFLSASGGFLAIFVVTFLTNLSLESCADFMKWRHRAKTRLKS